MRAASLQHPSSSVRLCGPVPTHRPQLPSSRGALLPLHAYWPALWRKPPPAPVPCPPEGNHGTQAQAQFVAVRMLVSSARQVGCTSNRNSSPCAAQCRAVQSNNKAIGAGAVEGNRAKMVGCCLLLFPLQMADTHSWAIFGRCLCSTCVPLLHTQVKKLTAHGCACVFGGFMHVRTCTDTHSTERCVRTRVSSSPPEAGAPLAPAGQPLPTSGGGG